MVKKRATGYLLQDIGLVALLFSIGGAALLVGSADKGLQPEFTVMLMGTFLAVLFAGFKLNSLAVVAAALEVLLYTAYKLYSLYAYSAGIALSCYLWLALPLLCVGSMATFIYGNRQTELENEVLKEQVEELVMVNALTGLYNLRSLYTDLKMQLAYAERNHMSISLMIVKLRYEQELKNILSRRKYDTLVQKLAELVTDAVRVEDRTYSLDNSGTVGVLLTCDQEQSVFVSKRIRAAVEKKEAFEGITDSAIRVEVKLACLQYDKEKYGRDMILFKQKVENELQYDV